MIISCSRYYRRKTNQSRKCRLNRKVHEEIIASSPNSLAIKMKFAFRLLIYIHWSLIEVVPIFKVTKTASSTIVQFLSFRQVYSISWNNSQALKFPFKKGSHYSYFSVIRILLFSVAATNFACYLYVNCGFRSFIDGIF